MKIILMERIKNLGSLGEEVTVANGFARNYLIPQGKAARATKDNKAFFEAKREELEAAVADARQKAEHRADKLAELEVTIYARTSAEGKIYGSVDTKQIADAVTATGVEIQKSEVRLNEGVLRNLGEYHISIQLYADVIATIKLVIAPEE